ncbi:AzlC family ABC transporter permease [Methanolobus sp. ZRKC3]|uniref:AzlC family ABC transporter permease n=1 Tax=Methanolobus sp. ZRKC3 TaxID=3125786 RepID=UPI00324AB3A0
MENAKIKTLAESFRATVPVMFGYIPIGIAFGLLVTRYGFHWTDAVLMSILIYSAAGQFLAIALIIAGAGMLEIVLTMLFLNLRHSFFGLSLLTKFSDIKSARPYLIFGLTDETYALITASNVPEELPKSWFYTFVTGLNHLYWITGTFLGALLGQSLEVNLNGLEFSLTALFVVLSIEQYHSSKNRYPFVVALVAGGLALAFVGAKNMLLVSIIIGTLILLAYEEVQKNAQ